MGKRGKPRAGAGEKAAAAAAAAAAADGDVVVSELDSAADLMEAQVLEADFKEAVDYLSNAEDAGRRLSEAQQRSLYGLFQVATEGAAPPEFDKSRYQAVAQWEAHAAVGSLSKPAAMTAYCALLAEAIPEYLFSDEDPTAAPSERPAEELPDDLRAQLDDRLNLGGGGAANGTADPETPGGALCAAAAAGRLDAVQRLLASAPDAMNDRDADTNATALMLACDREHLDVVQLLLQQPNLSLDAADADGMTALHYAVTVGSVETVRALLVAGANPTLADADGVTPLTMAKDDAAREIVALLEAAMPTA
eukprot:m.50301 g.50301  ORF g.50301 m.50301 type:complete len:308 (+) comp9004_c0_seq2:175-1098(+)